jgi:hypothetical protein
MPLHQIASAHRHRDLCNDSTLHVVAVISNPQRYESRYRLARKFIEEMQATPNVKLYVVETAFGDRRHEVTDPSVCDPASDRLDHHPRHLQLRTDSSIWIKESMINLGVQRLLPRDWRYLAWVDADVCFRDSGWALETIHQLQHYAVLQPWRHALDLDARGGVMRVFESYGYRHQEGRPQSVGDAYHDAWGHTGYGYACTRAFWEAAGGLLDFCILGSADRHMAYGMTGDAAKSLNARLTSGYRRRVMEWQTRAHRACNGQVGYIDGRIEHGFHGRKADRKYQSRWNILLDHRFDPDTDIVHDHQGLIQLVGKPKLEHAVMRYNIARNEDTVE